eukprot:200726-Rhodomonas_salina.1
MAEGGGPCHRLSGILVVGADPGSYSCIMMGTGSKIGGCTPGMQRFSNSPRCLNRTEGVLKTEGGGHKLTTEETAVQKLYTAVFSFCTTTLSRWC